MSWFTLAFTRVLPFVADVFETRDVKQSGNKLFEGLAKSLKEAANDPDKINEIATMLEEKKGELTGSLLARTPAAGLVDAEFMPPGSVDTTQEQVVIPPGATGPVESSEPNPKAAPADPTDKTLPAAAATEAEEYDYDDSEDDDDDTPEDEQEAPKAKAKKKKKK